MNIEDDFLSFYNKELAYLKEQGEEFSRLHPKIAGRLKLTKEGSQDPHVNLLYESFAFLSARIQHKLSDDFPELADALLNILYPHYLLPIPSLSVTQLNPSKNIDSSYTISKGSEIETSSSPTCKFTVGYNTIIYPIEIEQLKFSEKILSHPLIPSSLISKAKSFLKVKIKTLKADLCLSKIDPISLRFFINLEAPYCYEFYELIFKYCLGGVVTLNNNKNSILTEDDSIKAIGFGEVEGILPYPPQSIMGYRLLSEFFAFPQKYLFFDINIENTFFEKNSEEIQNEFEINLFFEKSYSHLVDIFNHHSLLLHCTPIINIFQQQAEPILIDHLKPEYPIILDARRSEELELYQVTEVKASTSFTDEKLCLPLYGFKGQGINDYSIYWHTRKYNHFEKTGSDKTWQTFITFVDQTLDPSIFNDSTIITVKTLCTNHSLPCQLLQTKFDYALHFTKEHTEIKIKLLFPFTQPQYLLRSKGLKWQLISHITLNHFSFNDPNQAKSILLEILYLYHPSSTGIKEKFIKNIEDINIKAATARCKGHYGNGIIKGFEIILTLNQYFSDVFLFSSVLEKFFSVYCSVNSFTKLTVQFKNQPEEIIQWQPQVGSIDLL